MSKNTALFLAVCLFLSGNSVFGQDQAPAPNYRNGDSWQFSAVENSSIASSTKALNGEFKLIYKGGDLRVVPVGEGKSSFKRSIGELKRMLAIDNEEKYLEFPLAINKKWSSEFRDELRGGANVNAHAEVSVTGYEEVATAAGKFKAFKIERSETSGGGGKGRNAASKIRRVEYVYYYSPDTACIVKLHRLDADGATRDLELTNYAPAK